MARQGIGRVPAQDKRPREWGKLLRLNLGRSAAMVRLALRAGMLPIWQKREAVIALIPLVDKASADFQHAGIRRQIRGCYQLFQSRRINEKVLPQSFFRGKVMAAQQRRDVERRQL
mgnify:CR=1 FL=1